MNELQAKLARRREMNGEAGIENKVESTASSGKYVPDPKSIRVSPKSKSPTREINGTKTATPPMLPGLGTKPISKSSTNGSSSTSANNNTAVVKPVTTGKLSTPFGKLVNVAALNPVASKPLFLSKQKPQEPAIIAVKEPEIAVTTKVDGEVNHVSN